MLDRAVTLAFRQFSTFFLIAALVTIPTLVVYSFIFRDEVTTRPLHQDIADLPPGRRVADVGAAELDRARLVAALVTCAHLALLPVACRAARVVKATDEKGGVPTAIGAWRGALGTRAGIPRNLAVMMASLALAMGVFALVRTIGLILLEASPEAATWGLFALIDGGARAAGAPFLLAGWVLAAPD